MNKDAVSRSKKRSVLSFLLYLCVTLVALCTVFLSVTANPNTFIKEFTQPSYIADVKDDVLQFTRDLCFNNSLPDDFLDTTITYDKIYNLENAYVYGELGNSQEFTAESYSGLLSQFKDDVAASVNDMVSTQGIEIEETVKDTAVDTFAQQVANYTAKATSFGYMRQVKSFCNLSKTVCSIVIIVCLIAGIGLVIAIFSGTSRKYRATRSLSYAFSSSAVMNLIVALAIYIVKLTKTLVIYPTYLVDVFLRWVDDSFNSVLTCAGILAIIFVAFACVTLKMKRDSQR
ncbi:hypothetical protein [uncultured Eubacterium sp.]|uniref:hypothetical protein n=1 Tax=uncultured Eubacterium sp. TaxID=165185 RepID=UPI00260AE224|nr:hypothetical protein [uncultured Eubacterium sp.]